MKKLSLPQESGFTLIEVLIAITIFSIGILAAITMQTTAISGNAKSRYILDAVNLAAGRVEILLDTDYSKILDWDGTNPGAAGLDDGGITPNTNADYSATSTDGRYNIYWNVVNNLPVSNSKTIKVIVTNSFFKAPVTITFVKAAGI